MRDTKQKREFFAVFPLKIYFQVYVVDDFCCCFVGSRLILRLHGGGGVDGSVCIVARFFVVRLGFRLSGKLAVLVDKADGIAQRINEFAEIFFIEENFMLLEVVLSLFAFPRVHFFALGDGEEKLVALALLHVQIIDALPRLDGL